MTLYYYLRASEGQKAALWPDVGQMLEGPKDVDQQGGEGHQERDDQPNSYVREWSGSAAFDGFGFLQVWEHPVEAKQMTVIKKNFDSPVKYSRKPKNVHMECGA